MNGNPVHRWHQPFSKVWPNPSHVKYPVADEQVHWFRSHLFSNGDLLAIYQADSDTPHGYGLAKFDKDSKLIWAYSGNVHHDLDVDEDGTIYTLVHEIVREKPAGLDSLHVPYLADYLVVLSSDGKEQHKIPLLEAFRDSKYLLLLGSISNDPTRDSSKIRPPAPPSAPGGPLTPVKFGSQRDVGGGQVSARHSRVRRCAACKWSAGSHSFPRGQVPAVQSRPSSYFCTRNRYNCNVEHSDSFNRMGRTR